MIGDRGEPLRARRLLLRVLVVPGLVVALALGATMASINALQHGSGTKAALRPARRPTRSQHRDPSVVGARRRVHATAAPVRPARTAPSAAEPTRRPARPARAARTERPRGLGAYVGPGRAAALTALSAQIPHGLGSGIDYLDGRTWSSIASPTWFVQRWATTHDSMTYVVPMLPETGASLAAGAAGAYDGEFHRLAEVLVHTNEARATLVVGSSPLEPGQPWSVYTAAAGRDYVAYFRRIVVAMRFVAGARFTFAFQPGPVSPGSVVGPGELYPGGRYVDEVAAQVFDQLQPSPPAGASRFERVLAAPFGLAWTARFAHLVHRRLVIGGLGLVPAAAGGAGDDPVFVRAFFAWARSQHVAAVFLWSEGSWAFLPASDPASFAVLRALVASGSVP